MENREKESYEESQENGRIPFYLGLTSHRGGIGYIFSH